MPKVFISEVRKVGFRHAVVSFNRRRHLLPVIGYLVLALFTGVAFTQERTHSNQNRAELAHETRTVLVAGCERQNILRTTLSDLVAQNIPETQRLVKEGTLTQAQADRSIAAAKNALKKLAPTDCQKAYLVPKSSKGN